jgi:phosphatidate cytidylyltransferase
LLGTRLIFGTIFVAALVSICWLDYYAARPGIYLLPLAAMLGLAAAGELLAMWKHASETKPLPWGVYGGTLLTIVSAGAPVWMPSSVIGNSITGNLGWLAVGLVASLLLVLIGEMRRYEGRATATSNLAHSCLAILYVGGLIGFIVQLRFLGSGTSGSDGRVGMLALLSLITIVKLSDVGQYFVGRLLGVRKLAPEISPGKTWEGVVGGLALATLGGLLTIWLARGMGVAPAYRAKPSFFLYPLALATFGIVGDLAESMLKRDSGVKDSSKWLPGFGGVLDLLDSLLGAAPIAFLCWFLIFDV